MGWGGGQNSIASNERFFKGFLLNKTIKQRQYAAYFANVWKYFKMNQAKMIFHNFYVNHQLYHANNSISLCSVARWQLGKVKQIYTRNSIFFFSKKHSYLLLKELTSKERLILPLCGAPSVKSPLSRAWTYALFCISMATVPAMSPKLLVHHQPAGQRWEIRRVSKLYKWIRNTFWSFTTKL